MAALTSSLGFALAAAISPNSALSEADRPPNVESTAAMARLEDMPEAEFGQAASSDAPVSLLADAGLPDTLYASVDTAPSLEGELAAPVSLLADAGLPEALYASADTEAELAREATAPISLLADAGLPEAQYSSAGTEPELVVEATAPISLLADAGLPEAQYSSAGTEPELVVEATAPVSLLADAGLPEVQIASTDKWREQEDETAASALSLRDSGPVAFRDVRAEAIPVPAFGAAPPPLPWNDDRSDRSPVAIPQVAFGRRNETPAPERSEPEAKASGPARPKELAAFVQDDEQFGELVAVGDEELSGQRGGFALAGMNINFGAELRSYIDGEMVLMTRLSWMDDSVTKTQLVSPGLTPAMALNGVVSSGQIRLPAGNLDTFQANNGGTVIAHGVEQGLRSVIINTANGVQLATEADVSLDVAGYSAFREQVMQMRINDVLGTAVSNATRDALGT